MVNIPQKHHECNGNSGPVTCFAKNCVFFKKKLSFLLSLCYNGIVNTLWDSAHTAFHNKEELLRKK